jgi:hypothetical protein
MELPKKIVKATRVDPASLAIYTNPKVGKTTIAAKLTTDFAEEGEALLIVLDPLGSDFVDAVKIDARTPTELDQIMTQIEKERSYKYIIIDNLSILDEWADIKGTYQYMSSIQGKKFNRPNGDEKATPYTHLDPEWESVSSLPNGNGYKWSRDWFERVFNRMQLLAEHVIFICHIKDKYVSTVEGTQVTTQEIDLTGKLKNIVASRVDAVARMMRTADYKAYLSFETVSEAAITGGRCKHLTGKILISEREQSGNIKTYWENIFTQAKKENK